MSFANLCFNITLSSTLILVANLGFTSIALADVRPQETTLEEAKRICSGNIKSAEEMERLTKNTSVCSTEKLNENLIALKALQTATIELKTSIETKIIENDHYKSNADTNLFTLGAPLIAIMGSFNIASTNLEIESLKRRGFTSTANLRSKRIIRATAIGGTIASAMAIWAALEEEGIDGQTRAILRVKNEDLISLNQKVSLNLKEIADSQLILTTVIQIRQAN